MITVMISVVSVITMVTMVPPVTTTILIAATAAADGKMSLGSVSGVHDHTRGQGGCVQQND